MKTNQTLHKNETLFLRTRDGVFRIQDNHKTKEVTIRHLTSEEYIKEKGCDEE